jgi:hypothetical protein
VIVNGAAETWLGGDTSGSMYILNINILTVHLCTLFVCAWLLTLWCLKTTCSDILRKRNVNRVFAK